jgi:hypothetical protein
MVIPRKTALYIDIRKDKKRHITGGKKEKQVYRASRSNKTKKEKEKKGRNKKHRKEIEHPI